MTEEDAERFVKETFENGRKWMLEHGMDPDQPIPDPDPDPSSEENKNVQEIIKAIFEKLDDINLLRTKLLPT